MKYDDFRYMQRGKQLSELKQTDWALLNPINQNGEGKNRALLALHGFSSSPAVYRYLLPKIEHYDAIVCPLLPGHGESIESFSKSKAQDWFLAAKNHCDNLIKTYEKVDILGLSLGGLLACKLCQSYPINHLYLLAPALRLNLHINRTLAIAQLLKRLGFRHIRNIAGNLMSNQHAEIAYRKLPISAVIEMLHYARQYEWIPPECPTDLFLGRFDQVVSSQQVEQLFTNLPNTKIHWLNQSAHVLPLDNDLNEIIDCINQSRNE